MYCTYSTVFCILDVESAVAHPNWTIGVILMVKLRLKLARDAALAAISGAEPACVARDCDGGGGRQRRATTASTCIKFVWCVCLLLDDRLACSAERADALLQLLLTALANWPDDVAWSRDFHIVGRAAGGHRSSSSMAHARRAAVPVRSGNVTGRRPEESGGGVRGASLRAVVCVA
ncbi:hypothetical protein PybrP1_004927 [[Pythium] brassicae (nom. inval.)]|nr:hypothetical protein PybrP1_004927 [[Pythium] brassicae (nom. inval.)]